MSSKRKRAKATTSVGDDVEPPKGRGKRSVNNGDTEVYKQKLGEALRDVQHKTGCTTRTLSTTLQELRPFFKEEYLQDLPQDDFRSIDRVINHKYAAISLKLNGCVDCHQHVFLPSDKTTRCPRCRFPRYNVKGQPNEVSCTQTTIHNNNNVHTIL